MDKLKLAHEYALKQMESLSENSTMQSVVSVAWKYADAMQAEADKRKDKTRPDVLLTKDKDGSCLHFHHEFGHKKCMDCGASLEEWQPDWSQAPEWANWWSVDENGTANFSGKKPHIEGHQWVYYSAAGEKPCHIEAPLFNYQGNWQDSLRKRTQ